MKPVAAATVTQRHSSDADTEETFGIDLTAQKKQTEKTNGIKAVSFRSLFRFASWFDMFLMSIGVLCAFANGGSISAFTIILGDVFNVLNTPNPLAAQVVALRFFYIAAGAFVVSFLQVAVFTATAERMTIRLRQQYLDSILKQDITFFDYNGSGVLVSQLAENSLLFRDAMGEKFGSLFQFGAMFVSGLIVGFVYLWQVGCAPHTCVLIAEEQNPTNTTPRTARSCDHRLHAAFGGGGYVYGQSHRFPNVGTIGIVCKRRGYCRRILAMDSHDYCIWFTKRSFKGLRRTIGFG